MCLAELQKRDEQKLSKSIFVVTTALLKYNRDFVLVQCDLSHYSLNLGRGQKKGCLTLYLIKDNA